MKKYLTLAELSEKIGGELIGDGSVQVSGANALDAATDEQVSFISSEKHIAKAKSTCAGAILTASRLEDVSANQILVDHVDTALIAVLNLFAPELKPVTGIHPTAVIEPTAKLGENVAVGPFSYIGEDVSIGDNSMIDGHCSIGQRSTIGSHTRLNWGVVIYHDCSIGSHCVLQANVVIGSLGFGYSFINGQHLFVPHNGGVIIEDYVDLGAGCCVDRAKFDNTVIGAGTKIDNLGQIGHNVKIGKCCIMSGQVGISGSAQIGNGVVLGGQVGIADNITIGDGVMCAAKSGLIADVPPGAKMGGSPANDFKQQLRILGVLRHLPEINKDVKVLTKKVEKLESSENNKK